MGETFRPSETDPCANLLASCWCWAVFMALAGRQAHGLHPVMGAVAIRLLLCGREEGQMVFLSQATLSERWSGAGPILTLPASAQGPSGIAQGPSRPLQLPPSLPGQPLGGGSPCRRWGGGQAKLAGQCCPLLSPQGAARSRVPDPSRGPGTQGEGFTTVLGEAISGGFLVKVGNARLHFGQVLRQEGVSDLAPLDGRACLSQAPRSAAAQGPHFDDC